MKTIKGLIFNKCGLQVLTCLYTKNPTYITQLARDTGMTYSHLHSTLLPLLRKSRLVRTHLQGRKRIIKLTKKGKRVTKLIAKTLTELKE